MRDSSNAVGVGGRVLSPSGWWCEPLGERKHFLGRPGEAYL